MGNLPLWQTQWLGGTSSHGKFEGSYWILCWSCFFPSRSSNWNFEKVESTTVSWPANLIELMGGAPPSRCRAKNERRHGNETEQPKEVTRKTIINRWQFIQENPRNITALDTFGFWMILTIESVANQHHFCSLCEFRCVGENHRNFFWETTTSAILMGFAAGDREHGDIQSPTLFIVYHTPCDLWRRYQTCQTLRPQGICLSVHSVDYNRSNLLTWLCQCVTQHFEFHFANH